MCTHRTTLQTDHAGLALTLPCTHPVVPSPYQLEPEREPQETLKQFAQMLFLSISFGKHFK